MYVQILQPTHINCFRAVSTGMGLLKLTNKQTTTKGNKMIVSFFLIIGDILANPVYCKIYSNLDP